MIFPCEKAVWYNLPQIRADLAAGLVKTGMTQSGAAKKLGVTPAAVSQYLNKKRGRQVVKSRPYLDQIAVAVEMILEGTDDEKVRLVVCKCCQMLTAESAEGGEVVCDDKEKTESDRR